MERLNKLKSLNILKGFFLILLPLLFTTACGVKGFPLPPLQPAPLGRGEPTYSKTSQKTPIVNHYDPAKDSDDEPMERLDER